MVEKLLALLLTLPPYHADREPPDARFARLTVIAGAVDEASQHATCSAAWSGPECTPAWSRRPDELAALLVTIAWHESTLARHVHAGECREWECDEGRARSLWQLHTSGLVPRSEWDRLEGVAFEPTARAAYAAARVLGEGVRRCRTIEGAIAFYARSSCRWNGAAARARAYRRTLERLQ